MKNTYYSNCIPDNETSLIDYRNYPYVDAILCFNEWYFIDFEDNNEYTVHFKKYGTYSIRSHDIKKTYQWEFNKEKKLFYFDGISFEIAFINESIIVFKSHKGDPSYFHLINSNNPISYYDFKTDIEAYITEITNKKEDIIYDKMDINHFGETCEILHMEKNKIYEWEKVDLGSDEYQDEMHQTFVSLEHFLRKMRSKMDFPPFPYIDKIDVLPILYSEGVSEMLHIIHEIYEFENHISCRRRKKNRAEF